VPRPSYAGLLAERRRQAFVGYDNLPPDTELQPLRLYVTISPENQIRIAANEVQSLLHCLPMATVCHEAHSHATDFCRSQLQLIDLHFSIDNTPNAQGHVRDDDASLQHVMVHPATVTMTKTCKYNEPPVSLVQFASASHVVDVITRLFGSGVERLIFNIWADPQDCFDTIYWPHSEATEALKKV
jgi:hypothetical protein